MKHKLGKRAPLRTSKTLRLRDFKTAPIEIPETYGNENLVADWGMLANDRLGDCAEAMVLHYIMQATACAGDPVVATDQDAINLYEAVTGYNPSDPDTDQGTILSNLLAFWRKEGIEVGGKVHKILGFVHLDYTNLQEIREAAYLFNGVLYGVQLPASAERQFDESKPWTLVKGSPIEGGHAIYAPGYNKSEIDIVSWGGLTEMTDAFAIERADEAWAVLTEDMCNSAGLAKSGIDFEKIVEYFKKF